MTSNASRLAWSAALVIGFWSLAVPPVHAYIDPGSGSYVFQVLIGFLLAAGVSIRAFWGRIRDFFTSRSTRRD